MKLSQIQPKGTFISHNFEGIVKSAIGISATASERFNKQKTEFESKLSKFLADALIPSATAGFVDSEDC